MDGLLDVAEVLLLLVGVAALVAGSALAWGLPAALLVGGALALATAAVLEASQ